MEEQLEIEKKSQDCQNYDMVINSQDYDGSLQKGSDHDKSISTANGGEDTKHDDKPDDLKLSKNNSVPMSIIRNRSQRHRSDRNGTLIEISDKEFESEYKGSPPSLRKRKTFQVTFKDKQLGTSLAKVIEVESYKKYNVTDPEVKL